MTKLRVTTENGDILFYGTESQRSSYTSGSKIKFVGSPQQHAELTRHLNRHSSSWQLDDRRKFDEGVVWYDLPPYFTVTVVPEDTSDQDAAVKANLPGNPKHDAACTCHSPGRVSEQGGRVRIHECPDQARFPAPCSADPYTEIIDIDYAYEGERFRAEETRNGKKFIRYGTFDMDGNAISPNYGWLRYEENGDQRTADAKIKAYGPGSGKAYINVQYDDRPEGYYSGSHPERLHRRNEGLHPDTHGLRIYGLPEINQRKRQTLAQSQVVRARKAAEAKLDAAQRAVRDAQDTLVRAERLLADLDKS